MAAFRAGPMGCAVLAVTLVTAVVAPDASAQARVTPLRYGPPWSLFVFRSGRDTVAIDRFQLDRDQLRGSMVERTAASVIVTSYHATFSRNGHVVSAEFTRTQGDGSRLADDPVRTRIHAFADSVVRETDWTGRKERMVFHIRGATVAFPEFIYGPTQQLGAIYRASNGFVDSIPAVGPTGDATFVGVELAGQDTLRLRGAGQPVRLVFEKLGGILLAVDARETESRAVATLSVAGGVDIEFIARGMKPLKPPPNP